MNNAFKKIAKDANVTEEQLSQFLGFRPEALDEVLRQGVNVIIQRERAQYFADLVRRWQRAVDNNDSQTIRDSQKALTQLGAVYIYPQGWTLGEDESE